MRVLVVIALLLAFCWTAAAQSGEIPRGAHVLLRMVNSVSTRTAAEGDFIYLRTASPIASQGRIIVPPDSYVQGVVAHVKRSSASVSGRAELAIRLETLTLGGGRVVKFTPKLSSVEPGDDGEKVKGEEGNIEVGPAPGRMWRGLRFSPGRERRSAGSPTIVGKAPESVPA